MAWGGRRRSPALAAAGCLAVAVRAFGASRVCETQAWVETYRCWGDHRSGACRACAPGSAPAISGRLAWARLWVVKELPGPARGAPARPRQQPAPARVDPELAPAAGPRAAESARAAEAAAPAPGGRPPSLAAAARPARWSAARASCRAGDQPRPSGPFRPGLGPSPGRAERPQTPAAASPTEPRSRLPGREADAASIHLLVQSRSSHYLFESRESLPRRRFFYSAGLN